MSAPPRVLVTRSLSQGSELAEHLRSLGAEPMLIPAIETVAPTSFAALDQALADLPSFDWLLFTSANAVDAFAHRHHARPFAPAQDRAPHLSESLTVDLKIAAIGVGTARALKKIGLTPDLVPPQAIAESLTEALLPHVLQPDGSATRFLLVRAEEAREHLPDRLRAAGAEVTITPAYRTIIPEASAAQLRVLFPLANTQAEAQHTTRPTQVPYSFANASRKAGALSFEAARTEVDAITFTSSSTARNLVALCEAAGVILPASALRVSIGPITSQTLRELDLPPHAEAEEATVSALAEAVMRALGAAR